VKEVNSMEKTNAMKIGSIAVIGLLLLSGFGMITAANAPLPVSPGYAITPVMRINSNAEMAIQAVDGDGSALSPWNLTGMIIDGAGEGYCIYIGNVTENYTITDSWFHNASGVGTHPYYANSGIIIYNSTNGFIHNNTVRDCTIYGIYMVQTNQTDVEANHLFNNTLRGIALTQNCTGDNIDENIINGRNWVASTSSNIGISAYFSDYCVFQRNECTWNAVGIGVQNSHNLTFDSNEAYLGLVGIGGDNCTMMDLDSSIVDNFAIGISLWNFNESIIQNGEITNCADGIDWQSSENNMINLVTIDTMTWNGIYLNDVFGSYVLSSTILNCLEFGFKIANYTDPNTHSMNYICGNSVTNCTTNAYDPGNITFWNTTYGNLWDDYSGTNTDGVAVYGGYGIGTTIYLMDDAVDYLPLATPYVAPVVPPNNGGSGGTTSDWTITVNYLDDGIETPLSGATITHHGVVVGTTNQNGIYIVTGLTAGEHIMTIAAGGYQTATITHTFAASDYSSSVTLTPTDDGNNGVFCGTSGIIGGVIGAFCLIGGASGAIKWFNIGKGGAE
jgi:parallel beta-helix repeat protein